MYDKNIVSTILTLIGKYCPDVSVHGIMYSNRYTVVGMSKLSDMLTVYSATD